MENYSYQSSILYARYVTRLAGLASVFKMLLAYALSMSILLLRK